MKKNATEQGFSFQGAWISKYATDEEKVRFSVRRKELKAEGGIKTVPLQDGKLCSSRRINKMKVIFNKTDDRLPIKTWLDDIEDGAMEQINNISRLPFAF